MIESVTAKKEAAAIGRGLFLYNGALGLFHEEK